jgi:virulence factor Mce-like protein
MNARDGTQRAQRSRLARRGIGLSAVLVLALGAYISTTANTGLPFERRYELFADVPNALRLIPSDEIRIAGVQVGTVTDIEAERRNGGHGPYARLTLELSRAVEPLPADTQVQIRSASVLGASFVDLIPGRGSHMLPPGGTVSALGRPVPVQLSDLLGIFNHATNAAIQQSAASLGPALAGRGADLGATLLSLSSALPPATRVAGTLAAPLTRLPAFLTAYDTFITAMSPVRQALAGLFGAGATTFHALAVQHVALAATIDELPGTEQAMTTGLQAIRPALANLATALTSIHAATPYLPSALRQVNLTASAGIAPLKAIPSLSAALGPSLTALGTVSRLPTTPGALAKVAEALGASALPLAGFTAAQVQCNLFALSFGNFASLLGTLGNADTPAFDNFAFNTLGATYETLQNASPSPDIGINYQPLENYNQCASGNEPYAGKQVLGDPAGAISNQTRYSRASSQVTALGVKAGLISPNEPPN